MFCIFLATKFSNLNTTMQHLVIPEKFGSGEEKSFDAG